MKLDVELNSNNLKIYCSKALTSFSQEFIKYYNKDISRIEVFLGIKDSKNLLVALTDKVEDTTFIYGLTDFSGFFTATGAFAYINLNGTTSKDYMYKGLMHELVHHLYKNYVYGKEKERITWVDEGLATFLSKQKEELNDQDKYSSFLKENLTPNIDLNKLNHNDRSFGSNNGYNLSYIAIRYLYETTNKKEFLDIIKDENKLKSLGKTILATARTYYTKKGVFNDNYKKSI
jgi:hypothetical protein